MFESIPFNEFTVCEYQVGVEMRTVPYARNCILNIKSNIIRPEYIEL